MDEQNISLRSKWPYDVVLQNDTWSQWIFTISQFAIVFFSALPNYLYFHIITVHEMPLEPFLPIVDFFLHVHSTLLTPSWCTIYNSRDHIISTLYFMDNKIMHLEWETVERGGYTDPFQFQWRLQWKMSQVQLVFHTHHDIRSPRLHVHLFSNWRQRSYSHAPSD